MDSEKLPPIHPGEILLEEFLEPMGISQYRLAKDISVPPPTDQRDCTRQACNYAKHSTTAVAVLWLIRTVLDESTSAVRSGSRERPATRPSGKRSASVCGGTVEGSHLTVYLV